MIKHTPMELYVLGDLKRLKMRSPVGTAVDVVDDIVVEATGRDDTKSNTVPIRDRRS